MVQYTITQDYQLERIYNIIDRLKSVIKEKRLSKMNITEQSLTPGKSAIIENVDQNLKTSINSSKRIQY